MFTILSNSTAQTANPLTINSIIFNLETQRSTKILGSHWTECWQLKKVYTLNHPRSTYQAFIDLIHICQIQNILTPPVGKMISRVDLRCLSFFQPEGLKYSEFDKYVLSL